MKPKVMVGINALTNVQHASWSSHMQLMYNLGRKSTNYDFAICAPPRMGIDRMRNFAAAACLEHDFEYLFFVDDDVVVPPDAFEALVNCDKDIVAGVTLVRGYPFPPMIFDFNAGNQGSYMYDYAEKADKNGLVACDAVGFSCCLIKVALLRKMEAPYFITGPNHTEDVYFCMRAKRMCPDVTIFANTLVETGHLLAPDIISPRIVEKRRRFEEDGTNLSFTPPKNDRGNEYYKQIMLQLGETNETKSVLRG